MTERSYARHLQILLLLRSRQTTSAVELANRFSVSIRTIYRDIEDMLEAGVPVQSMPGRSGGFRLVSEDPLESTNPDPDLAFRLYLLGFWNPSQGSDENGSPNPPGKGARSHFLRLIERIHFDTSDWYWRDEGSAHLQSIRKALQATQMLEVSFREKGETTHRSLYLKPLGLVWKAGQWYLIASQGSDVIERFSLNAIDHLKVTDATFVYPAEFLLKEWWAKSMDAYGMGPTRVVLEVAPRARDELARLTLKSNSQVELNDEGGMTLTLMVDRWEWLVPLAASYGGDVLVTEPDALRVAIAEHHQRALTNYTGVNSISETAQYDNDDSRLRTTRGRPQHE